MTEVNYIRSVNGTTHDMIKFTIGIFDDEIPIEERTEEVIYVEVPYGQPDEYVEGKILDELRLRKEKLMDLDNKAKLIGRKISITPTIKAIETVEA
jgi:hypothetical protein